LNQKLLVKVTFFTAVTHVQFASIPGRGDEISDGLYITTDKDTISKLLVGDVRNAIGALETDFLLDATAVKRPPLTRKREKRLTGAMRISTCTSWDCSSRKRPKITLAACKLTAASDESLNRQG
jgi:hypothetical protein